MKPRTIAKRASERSYHRWMWTVPNLPQIEGLIPTSPGIYRMFQKHWTSVERTLERRVDWTKGTNDGFEGGLQRFVRP